MHVLLTAVVCAIGLNATQARPLQPAAGLPPIAPTAPTAPAAPAAAPPLKDLEVSPFEAVEWDGDSIGRVKVAGEWFELLEINGWNVKELVQFARGRHDRKAARRVEEDLPQLLIDAGRPPAANVTLRLRRPVDGREVHVDVEMTKENRRALRDARRARERAAEGADNKPAPQPLDESASATAALREFRKLLGTHHSYSIGTPEGARLVAMVDEMLGRPEKPTLALAALSIREVLGASRDGHARVAAAGNAAEGPAECFAPCLFIPLADEPGTGVVAIKPDRSGLLDPAHPYVIRVNSVPIEERLTRASEFVTEGSPALVRERSCRESRSLGVIAVPEARLVLSASPTDTTDSVEWNAAAAKSPPRFGEWPRRESGRLEGGTIGYLRLAQMSDDPRDLERLNTLFGLFSHANGLIIDVRGNSGGSRDALMMIASACMGPDAAPLVFNAARPLTLGDSPQRVDARMATRFLRRADAPEWTERERDAIAKFVAGFTPDAPEVNLDGGAFGPWYYGVLSPDPSSPWRRPGRRTVVLMDNVCFSATDVFLSAMKQVDGVTLMGRPSAGGSGMAIPYRLAGGAITVNLSSMVSFQPSGKLFDGVGVEPHIRITPRPTDFIVGGTDTTLEAAVAELMKER